MDIDTLKLFVRVYESENFSKAATVLGMTQPSVSRTIADLEHRCGGSLFHRTGRGVTATRLGEMLFPRAQAMIMESEQLLADVHSQRGQPIGEVAVGISSVLPRVFIVELYNVLKSEAPGIQLRLREGFSDQIDKWISMGMVDIGVMNIYRPPRRTVEEIFFEDHLVLVRPPDSKPLPDTISFDRLAGFPLVLPSPPNGTRIAISDTARRRGIELDIAMEVDSLAAHFALVRSSGLYSLLGSTAVTAEHLGRDFPTSAVANPAITRSAVIKSTRQRPLSLAAKEVIKHIRNIAKTWQDTGRESG